MAHVHECDVIGCTQLVSCEDDCVEDEQESLCYCDDHKSEELNWNPENSKTVRRSEQ